MVNNTLFPLLSITILWMMCVSVHAVSLDEDYVHVFADEKPVALAPNGPVLEFHFESNINKDEIPIITELSIKRTSSDEIIQIIRVVGEPQ